MKLFIDRWISYKALIGVKSNWYKLEFEYFVFKNASLIQSLNLTSIMSRFPQYFY